MTENLNKILKNLNSDDIYYENGKLEENLTKLFKILYPHISEILQFYEKNGKFFYRGMSFDGHVFIYKPRTDRKPLNTDLKTHNLYDNIFNKITNNIINRSNAAFAVSNFNEAEYYGHVFIVFPFNNFDYLFSNKIKDLYEFYKKSKEILARKKTFDKRYIFDFYMNNNFEIHIFKKNEYVDSFFESLKEYYKKNDKKEYEKYNFNNAITRDQKYEIIKEIIKYGKSEKNHVTLIKNLLKKYTLNIIEEPKYIESFTKTIEKYYYFNTNLEEALRSKSEIMIRTDNMLCVHYSLLDKKLFMKIIQNIKK